MATIKMFKGNVPPMLKRGEWATNQQAVYLGGDDEGHKMFQSVFNPEANQNIKGFAYDAENRSFTIPVGTPLTKVQDLLDHLPRAMKSSNNDDESSIKLIFESPLDENDDAQIYKNDTEADLVIKDFNNYKLIITSTEHYPPAKLQFQESGIKIIDSTVHFEYIRIVYNNEETPIEYLFDIKNSTVYLRTMRYDVLHQKVKALFTVKGFSTIYLIDRLEVKANEDEYMIDNLFKEIDVTSTVYIRTHSSYGNFTHNTIRKPRHIVTVLYGDIKCTDRDIADDYYGGKAGGSFVEYAGTHFSGRYMGLIKTHNRKLDEMSNDDFLRNIDDMGVLMFKFFEQLAKVGFEDVRINNSEIIFTDGSNNQSRLQFGGGMP